MKKIIYFLFAFFTVSAIKAQFITTNPSTSPVTFGSDLNLDANKYLKYNGQTILSNKGTDNLFIGNSAGSAISGGTGNLFFGAAAGATNTTGNGNLFIGGAAGFSNNGNNNMFIGSQAGRLNTGGFFNLFIGESAGYNNGNAQRNIFIGQASGFSNTGGDFNTFIGTGSGRNNIDGDNNVFIGQDAGYNNGTGSTNTFIGFNAGVPIANSNLTNASAFGASASVTASNSLVLGNGIANVGINTSAPGAKLHVIGGGSVGTGVRFENLPIDNSGGTVMSYIVVDASGNLHRYTGAGPNARQGVAEYTGSTIGTSFNENWSLRNDFLYNKNKKGIIIGEGITTLPKGYGMYVTDGILTEKVKVAIKNSSDWADYVFNKDYKKMSLTDVEKFIKVNKHLPNMLSATDMVTEGNDLAKTDAKLLEKIEELTLYMIEMKKENTQMKRQINSLKRKMNK